MRGPPFDVSSPLNVQAGDWVLFATENSISVGVPEGWMLLGSVNNVEWMLRMAGAGEPPTYHFGTPANDSPRWELVALRGMAAAESQVLGYATPMLGSPSLLMRAWSSAPSR